MKSDGTVRCWGQDSEQQIGDGSGSTASVHTPVQVVNLTGIIEIDTSVGASMCALKSDGTVRCWGDDNSQQLGNGNADITDRHTPVQVVNMTGAISL